MIKTLHEPATVYGLFIGAISLKIADINAALTTIALIVTIVYTLRKILKPKKGDD